MGLLERSSLLLRIIHYSERRERERERERRIYVLERDRRRGTLLASKNCLGNRLEGIMVLWSPSGCNGFVWTITTVCSRQELPQWFLPTVAARTPTPRPEPELPRRAGGSGTRAGRHGFHQSRAKTPSTQRARPLFPFLLFIHFNCPSHIQCETKYF